VNAGNSLEKMICHQLAAVHRSHVQLMVRLNRNLETLECTSTTNPSFQTLNTETCRLANTLARLQASFNDGALTLQRLKTSGRQTVTVQHVQVNEGGQAVVAGQLKAGAPGASKSEGHQEKMTDKPHTALPWQLGLKAAQNVPRCGARRKFDGKTRQRAAMKTVLFLFPIDPMVIPA